MSITKEQFKEQSVTLLNKNGCKIISPLTAQAAKYLSDKGNFKSAYSDRNNYDFDRDNHIGVIIFIQNHKGNFVFNGTNIVDNNGTFCNVNDIDTHGYIDKVMSFINNKYPEKTHYPIVEKTEIIKDKDLAIKLINENPWNIRNISMNILSDDLLKLALSKDINVIEDIVHHENDNAENCLRTITLSSGKKINVTNCVNLLNKELFEYAVGIDCYAVTWVEEDSPLLTQKVWEIASTNKSLSSEYMEYIPKEMINETIVKNLINSKDGFKYIPQKFLTKERCYDGLNHSILAIKNIPDKFIDNHMQDLYNKHVDNERKDTKFFDELVKTLNYEEKKKSLSPNI